MKKTKISFKKKVQKGPLIFRKIFFFILFDIITPLPS
jgi:hypothetical protein